MVRNPGEKRLKHKILELYETGETLFVTEVAEHLGMKWNDISKTIGLLRKSNDLKRVKKGSYGYRITKQGRKKLAYFNKLWQPDKGLYKGKEDKWYTRKQKK